MFRYWKNLDHSCNIFISKSRVIFYMHEVVWKCFRCNLSFKDEQLADMHKRIANHSVTKVKELTA